jgi:hypothetical protein
MNRRYVILIRKRKGKEHNIKKHDNKDVDWIHVDQERSSEHGYES